MWEEEGVKGMSVNRIILLLRNVTDEERLTVFKEFCTICGADNPTCQCWYDLAKKKKSD